MPRAARLLRPFVTGVLGDDLPVSIRFWDASRLGPDDARTTIHVRSPRALRRIMFAPGEVGIARAYVAGDLDIVGDVFDVLGLRERTTAPANQGQLRLSPGDIARLAAAALALRAVGRPPAPPPEEARLVGPIHSRHRDAAAIAHHYDVSNEFYRLILGETMTYSCAYFEDTAAGLDDAQRAKHDLVCRKLGLREGMRLLDVGCGWGSMALHAAQRYDVSVVGITLSEPQAELTRKRIADAGVGDRVEIRLQDYRDVDDGPYDAISSIGMFEHVGRARTDEYFDVLFRALRPQGRLLNHAISRPQPGKAAIDRDSFFARYVFPDGELQEVGTVVSGMQSRGFEVRDVESLREHYGRTLRHWVANLEQNWEEAVRLAGGPRARIWRLYMAGSALGFEAGRTNVHQVLGIKQGPDGASGMPPTRMQHIGEG